jgi:ADP-heptose:LPS heptosyltransferase
LIQFTTMIPKKIVIIKPGASGDLLHITPSIRVLKRRFPEAQVDVMVGSCNDRLCSHAPQLECMDLIAVDEVFAAAVESGSDVKPCRW